MNKHDFEKARILYRETGGTVRGFQPEWDDFVKKHRRSIDVLCPLLNPAIKKQIAYRELCAAKNKWCPPWKNFKTWLYGSWWTEEIPQTNAPKPRRCRICNSTEVSCSVDGKGSCCPRQACRDEFARL